MRDSSRWLREDLLSRLAEVQSLIDADRDDPGSQGESIAAVARDLRITAIRFELPEIRQAARELELAVGELVPGAGARLMRTIRQATARQPSAILLVDDDPVAIAQTSDALSVLDIALSFAPTVPDFHPDEPRPSLAVVGVDPSDAGLAGLDALLAAGVSFVLTMSADGSSALAAACRARGAIAHFGKPADPEALVVAAARCLHPIPAHPDRRDPVTQLADRSTFVGRHDVAAFLTGRPFSVALVDPDRLGALNRERGDAAGDRLLERIATALLAATGDDPLAAWTRSWSGIVGLVRSPVGEVAALLEQILAELTDDQDPPGTFTAGVCQLLPGSRAGSSLAALDRLVFAGKRAGRARVVVGSEPEGPQLQVRYAEDETVTATRIGALLTAEGFGTHHSGDGRDAIEQSRDRDYDAFLLDVQMPYANGFEVLAALRRSGRHRRTPVVMLTSMGSPSDIARGLELGADDYLIKPPTATDLPSRLRQAIRHRLRS